MCKWPACIWGRPSFKAIVSKEATKCVANKLSSSTQTPSIHIYKNILCKAAKKKQQSVQSRTCLRRLLRRTLCACVDVYIYVHICISAQIMHIALQHSRRTKTWSPVARSPSDDPRLAVFYGISIPFELLLSLLSVASLSLK